MDICIYIHIYIYIYIYIYVHSFTYKYIYICKYLQEILVLRASNISSGEGISGLIFLRSLDIGMFITYALEAGFMCFT
jgi:hypothetical protein